MWKDCGAPLSSPGPAPSAAAKFRAQQAERMRRERARAAVVAWGATGAALAASAAGMVVFRQDVAEMWPRSASAFAALGLDVNVYGLEFYDLAVERAFDGPTPILLVSGEVRNIGRDEKLVPPVRVSLRDTQLARNLRTGSLDLRCAADRRRRDAVPNPRRKPAGRRCRSRSHVRQLRGTQLRRRRRARYAEHCTSKSRSS